jgi:endonuclease I
MKNKITLVFLLVHFLNYSQIPAGYYNSANGTGYTLKTQLHNIIKNSHNQQSYFSIWSLYTNSAFRDNYYENNGTLLDMYSENPLDTDLYEYNNTSQQCGPGEQQSEGECYNREHLVPQSIFNSALPMMSDVHHIVPSDAKVNDWRGDLPFGIVWSNNNLNPCNANGSNLPCHSSNFSKKGWLNHVYHLDTSGNFNVFEPIDEFKGDIARALLYFATRYEDQIVSFYDSSTSGFKICMNGTSNQVFKNTFLNILIKWHLEDPVSPKEIATNNAIYNHQGNRNPYVDNPNYVCLIWPTQCQTLSVDFVFTPYSFDVYPNPTSDGKTNISSNEQINKIEIININGQAIIQIDNLFEREYEIDTSFLKQGIYFLRITSNNKTLQKKLIIN